MIRAHISDHFFRTRRKIEKVKKIIPLKTNELQKPEGDLEFRISSSALANGLNFRPFRFLNTNSDQTVTSLKHFFYRPAKLRKGRRWWIEYYYRIPVELTPKPQKKEWEKFRVFEDINRVKTQEYADTLLKAVNTALEKGFNPFEYKRLAFIRKKQQIEVNKDWTVNQAINYFLQIWADRGNEPETLAKYKSAAALFTDWLKERMLDNSPINDVKRKWVELCLAENSTLAKWSNRTYNNQLIFLRTIFTFLVKEDIIKKNPATDIDKKRTKSKKHKYYDDKKFKSIRELMAQHDPLLSFAASLVYYLCIRSEKELKYFKLENIFLERRQALITAEDSKTDSDRFIPIPNALMPVFKKLKAEYPGNYYVIGVSGKNKFVAENKPAERPFGGGFLSKRFAKIRKLADLTSDYTLFGMRHTRVIHLKKDGAKDEHIMNLMGHTDFATTAKYLRDLGIDVDPSEINKKTRKF